MEGFISVDGVVYTVRVENVEVYAGELRDALARNGSNLDIELMTGPEISPDPEEAAKAIMDIHSFARR